MHATCCNEDSWRGKALLSSGNLPDEFPKAPAAPPWCDGSTNQYQGLAPFGLFRIACASVVIGFSHLRPFNGEHSPFWPFSSRADWYEEPSVPFDQWLKVWARTRCLFLSFHLILLRHLLPHPLFFYYYMISGPHAPTGRSHLAHYAPNLTVPPNCPGA